MLVSIFAFSSSSTTGVVSYERVVHRLGACGNMAILQDGFLKAAEGRRHIWRYFVLDQIRGLKRLSGHEHIMLRAAACGVEISLDRKFWWS